MNRNCDKLYSVGKFCTSLSREVALGEIGNKSRERFSMQCTANWRISFSGMSQNLKEQFVNF